MRMDVVILLRLFMVAFVCCYAGILQAQKQLIDAPAYHRCFTEAHHEWMMNRYNYADQRMDFERWMAQDKSDPGLRGNSIDIFTIPVIVHVISDGESVGSGRNLSYHQILSQIQVLNEDFRRIPNSPGYNNDPSGVDTGIEFCLASVDPDGNTLSEPGVNRINRFQAEFSAPPYSNTYVNQVIQPQTIWDSDRYMNIWVCELGRRADGGILGFAQLPFAPSLEGTTVDRAAQTDGVVIHYKAFGRTGDLIPPYTMGRTTTHEVGHWLGLIHTWGDGNCSVDDFCNDTPAAAEPVYGCPVNIDGCEKRNMVENYMQYTDDACMSIFTSCQKERMLTVLSNSPRRASLLNSTVCIFPEEAPVAAFKASTSEGCKGMQVKFADQSGNRPLSWSWYFPGGTPERSILPNPIVQYDEPGEYDVSLEVANAYGIDEILRNRLISVGLVGRDTFFIQDFESLPIGWSVTNPDEGITWEVKPVSGNKMGFKAARVHNFEYKASGQRDRLISPAIDLRQRQNVVLSFRHAYRPFGTSDRDSLVVYVSTDGGLTFPHKIFQIAENGSNNFATYSPLNVDFVPENIWDWCSVDNQYASCIEIDLNDFAGISNVKLAFEVVNDFGNNIYIDDIRLISDCQSTATSFSITIDTQSVRLYPNPAQDEVLLDITDIFSEIIVMKVFNSLGEEVLFRTISPLSSTIRVDVSDIPAGNYFVRIANNDIVTYHRLSILK